MQFILLLSLSSSIEGPGDFGNGSSGDSGRNPDGPSRSAVQQVMSADVQSHCWLNWRANTHKNKTFRQQISSTEAVPVLWADLQSDCCVALTQDVLNYDVGSLGGLRVASCIHSVDPELALLALLQVWDSDFSGWVELIGRVHPPPIRRALLMDLDNITLDGASTISVRGAPGECNAALGLVFNLGRSRWTGNIWERRWNVSLYNVKYSNFTFCARSQLIMKTIIG